MYLVSKASLLHARGLGLQGLLPSRQARSECWDPGNQCRRLHSAFTVSSLLRASYTFPGIISLRLETSLQHWLNAVNLKKERLEGSILFRLRANWFTFSQRRSFKYIEQLEKAVSIKVKTKKKVIFYHSFKAMLFLSYITNTVHSRDASQSKVILLQNDFCLLREETTAAIT